ncbi:MAG: sugar ABC transporter permease [Chloroflexota bacterium]
MTTSETTSNLPLAENTKKGMKRSTVEAIYGYVFLLPWILGFVVFTAGPMIASFLISLYKTDFLTTQEFVGFQWYRSLWRDTLVHKAMFNTAYYAFVMVPLSTILALLIAVLLNQSVRGQSFWRTVYYLPSVVSGVAVAILFKWLYQPDIGLLNSILWWFGITGPRWIFSQEWAMPSVIIMALWGSGGAMLIFLAGLRGIPTALYEAAKIDGAGPMRSFFAVTLPLLTPTIFFNVVLSIIASWQVFTQVLIMTRGGPNNSTLTMVLHLYNTGFSSFLFGYASAQAWALFLAILVFVLLAIRSSTSWVQYDR